ncbi:MAG: DUF1549 and DUF1553 domain-containing protein [Pseudomonadota bacterium]
MNRKNANSVVILGLASVMALHAVAAEAPAAAAASSAAASSPAAVSKALPWAYQPVKAVPVPAVSQAAWARTPIDNFVLAKLEAKKIKPSPEADRAAFVRRATLDAWGIIPTPEEVQAFVGDRAPDAYEKLVDRLLASPKYGERQGRRWLDLARYADSAGFTNDETRSNMWRYRDYVIKSFNDDKPYSRFIQEQVAGDELWPERQDALVATGFLRGYADDTNSRNLVQKKYQNTTDMTDTVGTVFLAQSIGCARCHNHKLDKVSQKEYFALQAFFANVSATDKIPAVKGPAEIEYERQYAKWSEATRDVRARQKALLAPVIKFAEQYYQGRFTPATQASLKKLDDPSSWTAQDRWVNHRYLMRHSDEVITSDLRTRLADYKELGQQYKKLGDELKQFDKIKPSKGSTTISAMTEWGRPDAPPTFVLANGIDDRPLEEVQPGVPALFNAAGESINIVPTATSSGRRSALANWIASPNNPLTARVFVNRVWAQYFGRGIVETVSDFGRAGTKPVNPELLDYLAGRFISDGWSVKKLQRQILLSSVYRQSSAHRDDAFKADPNNHLLAVFPRQRLDAEQIRDSLLAASGKLVDKVGGPSVFPPVPSNLDAGKLWTVDPDAQDQNRRSVYVFTRRSVPYPLLESFDMASPQTVHSKRAVTTSPLQALQLINSDVVYKLSQELAGRAVREAGPGETAQIERLYQILYARKPDKFEKATLAAYLDSQQKSIAKQAANGKRKLAKPTGVEAAGNPVRLAAMVDLAHSLANANEFTYRN